MWSVSAGIKRPWHYTTSKQSNSKGTRYRCKYISSWRVAQELLRQGDTRLDGDKDGEACEPIRRQIAT